MNSRSDQPAAADEAPYNLMLTESANVRLDLPLQGLDAVAEKVDEALKTLPARITSN